MAFYCETIESSKTWTCPKTGVWKVICIGGGGGGYAYSKNSSTEFIAQGGAGGTTSFGSYLSAAGGSAGSLEVANHRNNNGSNIAGVNGTNGYNGASAYGSESNNTTGVGYGASGGAKCHTNTTDYASAGDPGEVKTIILDLTANATVSCTIGAAGTGAADGPNNTVISTAYAGRAGAIIVQYLGSSF